MAVQTQTCLQPQGIPGTQAHRGNPSVGEQAPGQGRGTRRGQGDLKSILPGVARATHHRHHLRW